MFHLENQLGKKFLTLRIAILTPLQETAIFEESHYKTEELKVLISTIKKIRQTEET